MDVGLQLIFSSFGWHNLSDGAVYEQELRLAELAEEIGFDAVWPTEHHFFDYSFCPDNLELLAYVAGRTSKIDLGTAAVILPWNDPLRVAEKVSMLDMVSGGRVRFGMGRGLSRREFAPFKGIEMDESRDRFDEASLMIVGALKSGYIEGSGPLYPQPRTEIRPRPERSFDGRIYAVANSKESVEAAARCGARMIMFPESKWERRLPSIEHYREQYQHYHEKSAPPTMTADFTFCHEDPEYARQVAEQCMSTYLRSLMEHYELMGDHLEEMKGYQGYGKQAAALRKMGFEKYVDGFLAANAFGTPEQMIETYRSRRAVIGPFEEAACFRYGGISYEDAESSMRLFAEKVMPELKTWDQ